jgi:tRNA A-37 threonylcarbamoyl transferase component Bud32
MKLSPPVPKPSEHYRWYIAPEQSSIFTKSGLNGREERIIKAANMNIQQDGKTRTIFLLPIQEDFRFLVKRYKIFNSLERIKSFISPSKAAHEFKMHRYLKAKGIPVSQPIAYLENRHGIKLLESYLFLTEIPNAVNLKQFVSERSPLPITLKKQLLKKLGEIIRQIHMADFSHDDLHIGNILVSVENNPAAGEEPRFKLYLTDFHRSRRFNMTAIHKINNLGMLCYSLRLIFPLTDIVRFLTYYRSLDIRKETIKPFVKHVLQAAERIKLRHWASRTKRCLKPSSNFSIDTIILPDSHNSRNDKLKIYHKRLFPIGKITELVKSHMELTPTELFKVTSKRVISVLNISETEKCYVKEYRYLIKNILANIFRLHPAKSDWKAHNGLKVRGVHAPDALAMCERKIGPFVLKAYIITKEIKDSLPSGQYALANLTANTPPETKKRYLKELAGEIAHLHQRGIYHADLKANNILVTEIKQPGSETIDWAFNFIDLDRVRFDKGTIDLSERMKNLAQLNAATPGVITNADRLRFLHLYLACFDPLPSVRQKDIISEIINQTILRNHFWPVKK